jgi:hypothetical protein
MGANGAVQPTYIRRQGGANGAPQPTLIRRQQQPSGANGAYALPQATLIRRQQQQQQYGANGAPLQPTMIRRTAAAAAAAPIVDPYNVARPQAVKAYAPQQQQQPPRAHARSTARTSTVIRGQQQQQQGFAGQGMMMMSSSVDPYSNLPGYVTPSNRSYSQRGTSSSAAPPVLTRKYSDYNGPVNDPFINESMSSGYMVKGNYREDLSVGGGEDYERQRRRAQRQQEFISQQSSGYRPAAQSSGRGGYASSGYSSQPAPIRPTLIVRKQRGEQGEETFCV